MMKIALFTLLLVIFLGDLLANQPPPQAHQSLEAILDEDSLLGVTRCDHVSDSLRVEAYLSLVQLLRSNHPTQAVAYADTALYLSRLYNMPLPEANALAALGVIYRQLGDLSVSLDLTAQAERVYHQHDHPAGIASTYSNTGLIYMERGLHERAMTYYFDALRLFEELGDKASMGMVMNNIGVIYLQLNDHEQAIRFFEGGLQLKQAENDLHGTAHSLFFLGRAQQAAGAFELAGENFYRALDIWETYDDPRHIAMALSGIGSLHLHSGESRLARQQLGRALTLYRQFEDQTGIARTKHEIGLSFLAQGLQERALDFFQNSTDIALEVGSLRLLAENYRMMAKVRNIQGNHADAYQLQEKYLKLKDSVDTDELRTRMAEMRLIYDYERKENEIALLNKTNIIYELDLSRQRILRNYLLAIVLVVVVFFLLLYNRYRYVNKTNRLLEAQKAEISSTNRKLVELNGKMLKEKEKVEKLNQQLKITNLRLSESERHLLEVNATKDKFFSLISHDLRNPFSAIMSFSNILKRDMQSLGRDELHDLVSELDKAVEKINNLLENLLQWSRAQSGKIPRKRQAVFVHGLVEETMEVFSVHAQKKGITVHNEVDESLEVFADPNLTAAVLRNFLSNAIKFSQPGKEVHIRAAGGDNEWIISVHDQGIGIPHADQHKVFRMDAFYSTHGTKEEKGSGLGLLLCNEFAQRQGGKISFESRVGAGSTFCLHIPKTTDT